ncbi:dual specificity protein phosphatase family protein [Mucilaginibacter sp. AW1-3]
MIITWIPLLNGHLAIGHKPGKKMPVSHLKGEGTTTVVTLLNDNEGAADIGQQSAKAGIDWIGFPLSASVQNNNPAEVSKLMAQLQQRVQDGGKVYIHCSAGIHRTGIIAYGLLRHLGMSADDAYKTLSLLRPVTAAQVGAERLTWANQFSKQ